MARVGGPVREIKIPVQELWLKMQGGLIREGGAYMRDTTVPVFDVVN